MNINIEFLILYCEVTIAFVAFATIVATLRQAFGARFTPLNYVLFRFYVEGGLLHLILAIFPIALSTIMTSEIQLWRLSTYAIIIVISTYLPFYIHRRRKVDAKIPWVSLVVMVGYCIAIIVMIVTATELFWMPSLLSTTYFLVWGLLSNIAIFVYFLGTFVEIHGGKEDS